MYNYCDDVDLVFHQSGIILAHNMMENTIDRDIFTGKIFRL